MKILNPNLFETMPDAILFDTDNTLYHYDPAHKAAMRAVKEKVVETLSITEDQFFTAFNEARKQVKNRLGNTASSHSRLLYIQKMMEDLGLGSQVLLVLDLEQTYWRTFLGHAQLFSEVKELLDDIRLLGIPTAIVTDLTAQIQFRKIVYWGLDHFFDYIVTSEEAGYDKPHESSFNLAIEKMKVSGTNYWMIGDNPKNDIQGAREKIGAATIQKIHEGVQLGRDLEEPDAYFKEFSELRIFLKKLAVKSHG